MLDPVWTTEKRVSLFGGPFKDKNAKNLETLHELRSLRN